jgi:transcriptional regulator with XRE-family HTH domain
VSIGNKIKNLRKEKKWTQWDLARKLKVVQSQINRWESGQFTPSIEVLKKLSRIFDVSLDTLILDERDVQKLSLKDKTLLSKIKKIERLSPNDQNAIITMIEALLTKSA